LPYIEQNLSAVIFHDMGNVFASAGDIFPSLFRLSQKNVSSCRDVSSAATCDYNYFSHAVGGGLRYRTPIGPVRVDVGYNLNPTVFSIRTAGQQQTQTLRRINFFFSIGQTF
jgi:outer membrane protein insertion porin family